ncbi:DMT family transporter [Plasticicumulans acidivorans]|uniref:Threonine/homoserine efflux transporter RhtA n=1 Tax=Plasticicumulans acidivorans TaxID=886464 RepID=A0A317N1H8_9GAMM|nr:EamA family transporter [Plasticicumulans acidivorans]PWV63143.1 threonine/homoserine efflux transporter RhtA [Plasticicumulans acidivorans]
MNALLFALTALLWGGGALATALQAGVTPAAWSVALRMALAGVLLLGYGRWRGERLYIPPRERPFIVLQGVLFFAGAFIAFYEATRRIPSGLAALVLSTSSLFAALLGRLLFGTRLSRALLAGMLCGCLGVGIIFGPGIDQLGSETLAGCLWALAAAVATAAGTVVGARNQAAGLPTLAILGWGALVGALSSAGWALASGEHWAFEPSLRYLASLLYLAVAASCVTFMLYFELVRRVGPGRAAYTLASVPLLALLLSALFEGLRLDAHIALGAAAVLAGNVLVLRR